MSHLERLDRSFEEHVCSRDQTAQASDALSPVQARIVVLRVFSSPRSRGAGAVRTLASTGAHYWVGDASVSCAAAPGE